MKWSELLEAAALARPDSEVLISDGGTITRVEPSKVFADQTREVNGHVTHAGKTRPLADAAVLVSAEDGSRGDLILLPGT